MSRKETHPCHGGPYELASRFLGTWHEFTVKEDGSEILEGTLFSKHEVDGCVLTQRFTSVDGTFSFLSFAYVDASTNCWIETYAFNNGRSTQWRWVPQGNEIIMEHILEGHEVTHRLRIVNQTKDNYEVIEEKRESGEAAWKFVVRTRTRRIE